MTEIYKQTVIIYAIGFWWIETKPFGRLKWAKDFIDGLKTK